MIIIGYQGVGKSTLAKNNIEFIDLESSNFFVNGKRQGNWCIVYCGIAIHLSKQGKNVFVSSHEVVRRALEASDEKVIVVYPSIALKDEWIKKLEDRYNLTGLDKDYKALMNAKDRYEENILELQDNDFIHLQLDSIDYDLLEEIKKVI